MSEILYWALEGAHADIYRRSASVQQGKEQARRMSPQAFEAPDPPGQATKSPGFGEQPEIACLHLLTRDQVDALTVCVDARVDDLQDMIREERNPLDLSIMYKELAHLEEVYAQLTGGN